MLIIIEVSVDCHYCPFPQRNMLYFYKCMVYFGHKCTINLMLFIMIQKLRLFVCCMENVALGDEINICIIIKNIIFFCIFYVDKHRKLRVFFIVISYHFAELCFQFFMWQCVRKQCMDYPIFRLGHVKLINCCSSPPAQMKRCHLKIIISE